MSKITVSTGDCVAHLAARVGPQFDSCVCDPPYEFGFMGKEWDSSGVAFRVETWLAVFDKMKPGAHLIAFGGTRTYHRMVCAIEDAGFEIRDMLSWNYGSGFPKSHNIIKKLQDSGLSCHCHTTIVSGHCVSEENLRDLRIGLDAHNALSSGAESDLRTKVLSAPDRHETGSAAAEGSAVVSMRDVRDSGSSPPIASISHGERLLQRVVPVEVFRGSAASDGREHDGPEARASIRHEEPGVEGRGDAQATEGKLQGCSLCEGAGMGAADGSQGRIHHGAQARDGEDVRLPDDANGSGQSHRPQPRAQSPEQSGDVADECGSQTWGGWPVCPGCLKPVVPEGYGTALKPALEPIVLARKPLSENTIAANVLRWGTGALNIDGCRIEGESTIRARTGGDFGMINDDGWVPKPGTSGSDTGRWPANVIHDGSEEVLGAFPDTASGLLKAGRPRAAQDHPGSLVYGTYGGDLTAADTYGDSGSAARFFYSAKAGPLDRMGSEHPTVKPVDLMRWLCRLVTPPGGTILDPFAGSGTTGIAAMAEGFNAELIDLEPKHVADIERKLALLRGEGRSRFAEQDERKAARPNIPPMPLFGDAP